MVKVGTSKRNGPGQGAPREPRQFDQTYLEAGTHGRKVHRDYAAHFFRWGFAFRFGTGRRVLDVGCGPEWQLGYVLCRHGQPGARPEKYVGVDLSPIVCGDKRTLYYDLWGEFDFCARYGELGGGFDVACCFEVIEHMGVEDGARLIAGVRECLKGNGVFLVSTPRNEGRKPARNHVHEWSVAELRRALEEGGFKVVRRFGTFGDVGSIRAVAGADERAVMDRLGEYYSNEVLSCFLAPLYPDACKNNLWVCEKK